MRVNNAEYSISVFVRSTQLNGTVLRLLRGIAESEIRRTRNALFRLAVARLALVPE
jgi:hypothetical protein